MTSTPRAPRGARTAGRRLWADVTTEYELEQHELLLLREAVRVVDLLDALHDIVEREGVTITGTDDGPRTHPAVVEARQSRIALARILAALRLPAGEDGDADRRPQRRSGARGVYAPRSVA